MRNYFIFLLLITSSILYSESLPNILKLLNSPKVLNSKHYSNEIDENLLKSFEVENNKRLKFLKAHSKLSKKQIATMLFQYKVKKNQTVISDFLSSSEKSNIMSSDKILSVFNKIKNHKVTDTKRNKNYDKYGDIGFCFGRAFYAHYLLRKMKVPQVSIAKLFIVGRLMYLGQLWNFHMATTVKGADNKWWVLDTLFKKPMELQDWAEKTLNFGIKRSQSQARIYITDPRKFQPAFGAYSKEHFQIPELSKYFDELLRKL